MSVANKSFVSFFSKKTYVAGILVLTACMFVNCWHMHLWGPDEPREAEIAREIFLNGSWSVPLFNGMPFVEKPPFYYDISALIYACCPHPGALRLHSALLGWLMLVALYYFALKKCGKMTALCACALCISMPQFYRAAHWILLDIGVGAWITACLVCYGLWSLSEKKENSSGLAVLFFFFASLGMLTKGIITLVYLGCIILPHWFFFRKKPLPPIWTLLFFLIPVGIWLCFFYREGGIYFLHEHFINNVVGRLLHREFRLEGSPIVISDVGHASPVLFYFKRLPNMFGAALVLLFLSAAWAWRVLGWKFFHWTIPTRIQWIWDLLTKPHETARQKKDLLCYLMLWSFVPIFVFSIPSIKEVTYLLPSYAGIALLAVCYVQDRLPLNEESSLPWGCFILPLLCFALTVQTVAGYSLILFWSCIGLIYVGLIWELIRTILHRDYQRIALPILAALIGGILIGNTPELMERSRLDRKCYCLLSEKVWEHVGSCSLYLNTSEESIRGALPFYGKRDIRIVHTQKQLKELLAKRRDCAFLLYERQYNEYLKDSEFTECLPTYKVISPGFPDKADVFLLLVPRTEAVADHETP